MSIAAGFQSGIALGRAFNEGRERRRLEGIRTAAPETSQGYTAEQGQQLEAMASAINPETGRPYYNVQAGQGGNYSVTPDFTEAQTPRTGMDTGSQFGVANVELQPTGLGRAGVAAQPIPFNQQQVTDFLGRRFEGELAPDRIEAMRSRAMAEGLSDPRQRQAALAEATRAEREAEEAPLRRRALESQIATGELGLKTAGMQLTAAERTAAAAQRTDDFNAWRSENPGADFGALTAKAQELGMGVDEQFKLASNLTGIGEQEFKMSQQRIQKLVQNKGLDGLLKAHKESNDLDPTSHFEVTRGKGGQVSLNRVDTNTGEIIQPNVFSGNEAETTAYLNRAAMNPATIIDYTMNLEKIKLGMDKDRAAIRASDRSGIRVPDINEYVDAQGNVILIDVGELPRGEDKQPILPPGLSKLPTGSAKDLSPQQQRAFDTLKNTDAFKNAVERGDQPAIRKLLTDNAIPPEAFFGATAAPPGGGDWTAAPTPEKKPAAERPAASGSSTAQPSPTQGLTREQIDRTVTQQQADVQAETRVRRAALAAFEKDPRVIQAFETVRQLRRDGQAVRANDLQNQISAQRDRFIEAQIAGGR